MGFHTLTYFLASQGAAITDFDMTAVVDSEFSQRNGHYIFTEQYKVLGLMAYGATITRANVQIPTWNAIGRMNIYNLNASSTVQPSPPKMDNWWAYPPPLPQNEELTVKMTDGNATGEATMAILFIGTQDWNQNIPPGVGGVPIIEVRVTASPTAVAGTYSSLAAITFEQSPRGGVYAVVGADWQGTNAIMVRMVFPRQRLYNGRKLRPGVLARNAITDQPLRETGTYGPMFWGVHGMFSTFEPPQIEVMAFTAGAITLEGRLYLVRISDAMDVPV